MTSSGRELLKWIAVVLMTGDHAAKVFAGGYVPVISELGRIAFPVFAIVMAYNLALPNADCAKSVRRLAGWGLIAQPAHALAFGFLLPLNVLFAFALSAACCWCAQNRRWWLLLLPSGPLPLLVDYEWAGIALVLAWWWFFKSPEVVRGNGTLWVAMRRFWLAIAAFVPLCLVNGNVWAVAALPLVLWLSDPFRQLPAIGRSRWAFYGYYVGHLAVLAVLAQFFV